MSMNSMAMLAAIGIAGAAGSLPPHLQQAAHRASRKKWEEPPVKVSPRGKGKRARAKRRRAGK